MEGREKMINSALEEITSDVIACATLRGIYCVIPQGDPDRVDFRFNLNDIKKQPRSDPGREKQELWLEERRE